MGIVNRIQNAWTRQQLFNPDTLVLRSVDGKNITVNGRDGLPTDITTHLPATGEVIGLCSGYSTTDQLITNVEATVQLPIQGVLNYGSISLVNSQFIINERGVYEILIATDATQNANNNVLAIWLSRNGVSVANSAIRLSLKTGGEQAQLGSLFIGVLAAGDVLDFRAKSSLAAGATLNYTAPSGNIPATVAARASIRGLSIP